MFPRLCIDVIGGGDGEGRGDSCPPLADKGANGIKCPPHPDFADLTDLVTECMKKTLILSGDFRFRLSAVSGISFSSAFSFMAENEKMLFGPPLVYIT